MTFEGLVGEVERLMSWLMIRCCGKDLPKPVNLCRFVSHRIRTQERRFGQLCYPSSKQQGQGMEEQGWHQHDIDNDNSNKQAILN